MKIIHNMALIFILFLFRYTNFQAHFWIVDFRLRICYIAALYLFFIKLIRRRQTLNPKSQIF